MPANKKLVLYFGSRQYGICRPEDVVPWAELASKAEQKGKERALVAAIKEAQKKLLKQNGAGSDKGDGSDAPAKPAKPVEARASRRDRAKERDANGAKRAEPAVSDSEVGGTERERKSARERAEEAQLLAALAMSRRDTDSAKGASEPADGSAPARRADDAGAAAAAVEQPKTAREERRAAKAEKLTEKPMERAVEKLHKAEQKPQPEKPGAKHAGSSAAAEETNNGAVAKEEKNEEEPATGTAGNAEETPSKRRRGASNLNRELASIKSAEAQAEKTDEGKDVGRRVGIWWVDDGCFYMGRVLEQKRGRSLVLYEDDNVEEWLHLDREVTKWEDGQPGPGKPLELKPKKAHPTGSPKVTARRDRSSKGDKSTLGGKVDAGKKRPTSRRPRDAATAAAIEAAEKAEAAYAASSPEVGKPGCRCLAALDAVVATPVSASLMEAPGAGVDGPGGLSQVRAKLAAGAYSDEEVFHADMLQVVGAAIEDAAAAAEQAALTAETAREAAKDAANAAGAASDAADDAANSKIAKLAAEAVATKVAAEHARIRQEELQALRATYEAMWDTAGKERDAKWQAAKNARAAADAAEAAAAAAAAAMAPEKKRQRGGAARKDDKEADAIAALLGAAGQVTGEANAKHNSRRKQRKPKPAADRGPAPPVGGVHGDWGHDPGSAAMKQGLKGLLFERLKQENAVGDGQDAEEGPQEPEASPEEQEAPVQPAQAPREQVQQETAPHVQSADQQQQQAAAAGAPLMAFLQPTLASLAGAAAGASAQSLMQLQQALLQQQAMLQQTVLAVQALWHEVPDPSTGQSVWVNVVTRETLPQSPLLQLIALLHGLHASVLLPLQMQRDGTAAGVAAAQQVQAHAAVQAQAQAQELARAQTQAQTHTGAQVQAAAQAQTHAAVMQAQAASHAKMEARVQSLAKSLSQQAAEADEAPTAAQPAGPLVVEAHEVARPASAGGEEGGAGASAETAGGGDGASDALPAAAEPAATDGRPQDVPPAAAAADGQAPMDEGEDGAKAEWQGQRGEDPSDREGKKPERAQAQAADASAAAAARGEAADAAMAVDAGGRDEAA